MKVVRERPSQRRHHRVAAPMLVQMPDGKTYKTADWSLGGLRISDAKGELPAAGEVTRLKLELPFQGFDIAFDVEAKVVRADEETRTIAYQFMELEERASDLLRHFIEDLVRGKMASVDDTICRIDVPVTPISTKPDVNPQHAVTARRWPLKTIIMSAIYILAGAAIFSYSGFLLYAWITRIEVPTAVVSAPMQTVKMPVDGILHSANLQEGVVLARGQDIARIEDGALKLEIERANARLRFEKDRWWQAEQALRIETERLKLYQVVSETDRDIAQARLEAKREALKAADANITRVQSLVRKGVMPQSKLDEALKRQGEAAAAVREAELLAERAVAMDSVSDRRHFNHKEFVADLDMAAIAVAEARSAYEAALLEVRALTEAEARRVIRAPFDSRIVKVIQFSETQALRDEPVAVLEALGKQQVTAFLRQDEILEIGLGDLAEVYLPALQRSFEARVVKINRSSTIVDGEVAHYSGTKPDDRSAAVVLEIVDPETGNAGAGHAGLQAGLPAIVYFSKGFTRRIRQDLSDGLGQVI